MKLETFVFKNETYDIIIGSNKNNNWEIFDNSKEYDILFHVSPGSSSYVILKNNTYLKLKDVPKQIIKRCCCLCKSHSNSKCELHVNIIYSFKMNCIKGENMGSVYIDNSRKCII